MSAGRLSLVTLFVCASLCLALVGCARAQTSGGATGSSSSSDGSDGAKRQNLAFGSAADYGGLKVTVVSAEEGPRASSGKPTLVVRVRYENNTENTVSYDEYDWSLEDPKGVRTQGTATFDQNLETLGSGELVPGSATEADVYFAEPENVQKVVYAPSMSSGEQDLAKWAVE